MCIICASRAGVAQPDEETILRMFDTNPHGAGYMVARAGRVEISKGFMSSQEFLHAVRYEHFTAADPVVYHFRISTQAGVTPEMTHPFPLSTHIEDTKLLDCTADVGVAHNGIIRLTSNPRDHEYSDTAHFVAEYLAFMVHSQKDLKDPDLLASVQRLIGWSKLAIMDKSGYIATIGDWITEKNGLMFSNGTYRASSVSRYSGGRQFSLLDDWDEDDEDDEEAELDELDDMDLPPDDYVDEYTHGRRAHG